MHLIERFNSKNTGADVERLELLKVEYIRKLYDILEYSLYELLKIYNLFNDTSKIMS